MKKISFLLFALLAVTAVNAQILKGDMNGDGKITMADANEVANTYLGAKAVEELSVYAKDKVDEMSEKILQKLESIDARLAAIEAKLGMEGGGGTDDDNPQGGGTVDDNPQGGITDNTPVGIEAVDLGLSVKWASCNVGASKPEEYGDYFAWGETTPKSTYDWSTYKWCNGSSSTMTKYCINSSYGTVDNKTVLDKEDDAASVNWGGSWRMPTRTEQDELRNTNNCTWTWTTMNGVNGYKVVSNKNGNFIFLPAAGNLGIGSSGNNTYTNGHYWSSSLKGEESDHACYDRHKSTQTYWSSYYRYEGKSVRAVCP